MKTKLCLILFFSNLFYPLLRADEKPSSVLEKPETTQTGVQTKIKDLVNIRGVRSNALIGYGLVMGLSGTGDSKASVATMRAAAAMLNRLGMNSKLEEIPPGNIASVVITAELPPFAKIGDKIDVRVSANSNAKSLAGGTLLFTPLRAADGEIYATVQGAMAIGQANGSGNQVLTVARVPQGGVIEKEFTPRFLENGLITLSLKRSDFTTNTRIVHSINSYFKGFYAQSVDPSTLRVEVPTLYLNDPINFISELEQLKVSSDIRSLLVVNERTGTVVLGNEISIHPVTISHGDLSIKVQSQDKKAGAKKSSQSLLPVQGATVADLVGALNALGVKPADLTGILQSMHAAGAIDGEIQFL
ncbi:MAG: flagellar basal body P-ring protein FlgI [Oligoflexales bacterium]|nr:flagellar basal body P-ring protein FlgI [Oligoflexales bacterium]